MPHVIVKLWPGRSDEIKTGLAKKIAELVSEELNVDIGDLSVAFEEVKREDWGEQVYKKEIKDNRNLYYRNRFANPVIDLRRKGRAFYQKLKGNF